MQVRISVSRTGDEAVVSLSGSLGPGFREATLPCGRELAGVKNIRFSLRGVTVSAGLGYAEFAAFVTARERRGATVTVDEVPWPLAQALFMAPEPWVRKVTSFYVPYACLSCSETREYLLYPADLAQGVRPEPPGCSAGHPMDDDGFLEFWLSMR